MGDSITIGSVWERPLPLVPADLVRKEPPGSLTMDILAFYALRCEIAQGELPKQDNYEEDKAVNLLRTLRPDSVSATPPSCSFSAISQSPKKCNKYC